MATEGAIVLGGVILAVVVGYAVLTRRREAHVVPPRQTWLLRALNASLRVPCWLVDTVGYRVPKVGYMLERPLSLEKLMRTAERRTGLRDWRPSATFPALYEIAVARLNEVEPTPFGRLVTFDYLMRRLMTRLRVIEASRKTSKTWTKAPVFVMGLPRTGTTFLHRLLALDPDSRFPRTYELLDPVSDKPTRKRVKYVASKLELIKKLIPHIEAIHELGALEAEECLLALSVEVPLLPPTFRHIVRHCADQDSLPSLRDGYDLYKTQLELLAGDEHDAKRWVLKCPAHLAFVSDLLAVFPDAHLVWTHRDPLQSLPSLGSMFRTFADMCEASPSDLHAIGREQLRFWTTCIAKADADLAAAPSVAHVKYADFIDNPLAVVARVYAAFGWTVSPRFEANVLEYLDTISAKRGKIPAHLKRFHAYTLAEYGLDAPQVRAYMAEYYKAHLDGDD